MKTKSNAFSAWNGWLFSFEGKYSLNSQLTLCAWNGWLFSFERKYSMKTKSNTFSAWNGWLFSFEGKYSLNSQLTRSQSFCLQRSCLHHCQRCIKVRKDSRKLP